MSCGVKFISKPNVTNTCGVTCYELYVYENLEGTQSLCECEWGGGGGGEGVGEGGGLDLVGDMGYGRPATSVGQKSNKRFRLAVNTHTHMIRVTYIR